MAGARAPWGPASRDIAHHAASLGLGCGWLGLGGACTLEQQPHVTKNPTARSRGLTVNGRLALAHSAQEGHRTPSSQWRACVQVPRARLAAGLPALLGARLCPQP